MTVPAASVPEDCTVLVVGGGPGGSYTASVLSREGIDVVVLEADVFPRYHIGESMIASMRHFLRFIDLDEKFNGYGFQRKNGGVFRMNGKPVAYNDFLAAGGPDAYAWNVIRSQSDELMFRHAGDCGARLFEGIKVNSFDFVSKHGGDSRGPGQPMAANWQRKDGTKGRTTFQYLVDASGRAGLMSTKYLKNRKFNKALKNLASWGYWKGTTPYGTGTHMEGQPFFEALADSSGWCWKIPLHDGTDSVGIVMNQEQAAINKRAMGSPTDKEFYLESLKLAPVIYSTLSVPGAELATGLKHGTDWSYSASSYAGPGYRIVGDAGAFIDPYFSSGVHLALAGALSAAVTICAALRGDCSEETAARWHSDKVTDGYTRFLLVVLTCYKQIRNQEAPILSDFDEAGFDRAFAFFRPVINGIAEVAGKVTQKEIVKTVEFCLEAFQPLPEATKTDAVARTLESLHSAENSNGGGSPASGAMAAVDLTAEERRTVNVMLAKKMMRTEDSMNIDNFTTDVLNGMAPRLKRGALGLMGAEHVVRKQPMDTSKVPDLTASIRPVDDAIPM